MSKDRLITHLAGFAHALRARRVRISLSDEIDAATALTLVDLFDREEVRQALRAALRIRHEDWPVFEEEFRRLWQQREVPVTTPPRRSTNPTPQAPRQRSAIAEMTAAGAHTFQSESPEGEEPGYSPEVVLRKKPFDECTPRELRELERILERMTLELAT